MAIGPLMIDLAGTEISSEERAWLQHPAVGGVILFTRNFVDKAQLTELVADLHSIKEAKLLIAIDQEGGRVQRLREGFIAYPPMRELGKLYDQHPERALQLSNKIASCLAQELREIGIDFTFAPVLDLDSGCSTVIGDRAFHCDADIVSLLAEQFIQGLSRGGMAAVGKHFPGHGSVVGDSHEMLPVDSRHVEEMLAADLIPFQRLINAGIAGLMTAHVVYQQSEAIPASFSHYWIGELLRGQFNYQGVVFSDDLTMQGAQTYGGIEQRLHAALDAGCDMALICNSPQDIPLAIASLEDYSNATAQQRLEKFYGRSPSLLTQNDMQDIQAFISEIY